MYAAESEGKREPDSIKEARIRRENTKIRLTLLLSNTNEPATFSI